MTPRDEQYIRKWSSSQFQSPPTIRLNGAESPAGDLIAQFCDRIGSLVETVKVRPESDLPFPAPAMVVGHHRNIAYQALPTGKLLETFLEALRRGVNADTAQPDRPAISRLQRLHLPSALKLYVAGNCPHCPQSIRQLQDLAASSALIRLRVIDAELFSQQAQTDLVRSVPTLILDDQYRWTGPVYIEELLNICIERDPAGLSAASLRQLIEAGDAARVAGMMVASGKIFPALTRLLEHERWSVRLGAMVAAEYLADEAPDLSLRLCELLWRHFPGLGPQVQGDVVQVFGQNDSRVTRGYLDTIAAGSYEEEVRVAAVEVLDEMEADPK